MKLCGGGCRSRIQDSARFCPQCLAEKGLSVPADNIRTHTSGYTEVEDALRKSKRWQSTRRSVLQRDPFCKRCDRAVSTICDHRVPAPVAIQQAQESGRYPLDKYAGFFLKTNLQGLCRECHGTKTLEDKSHVGPWPDVVEAEAKAPRKVWSF